jgi:hypothetical protein
MQINTHFDYKFRAECAADAHAIRSILHPWLIEWSERRENLEYHGVVHAMTDVIVEFSIVAGGPDLAEVLWLVDTIDNAHIAGDTLTTVANYTGERTHRRSFELPAKRPDKEILSRVLHAVRTRQQVLIFEQERALQLNRTIGSALRLGDKAQASKPELTRPGWMVPITHIATGLTALRRICAPAGCKDWEKKEDGIVKARVATLHA